MRQTIRPYLSLPTGRALALSVATALGLTVALAPEAGPLSGEALAAAVSDQSFVAYRGDLRAEAHFAHDGRITFEIAEGAFDGVWFVAGAELCLAFFDAPLRSLECAEVSAAGQSLQASNGAVLARIPGGISDI